MAAGAPPPAAASPSGGAAAPPGRSPPARPWAEVRDLPGHSGIHHSSTQMTERYAHLAPERVRAAVEVLTRGDESGWERKGSQEVTATHRK